MHILPRKKYKISLLGDDCLDIYWFGTVDRISPEAPVPVFCPQREERRPGMAGNVKLNLEQLGAQVGFYAGTAGEKTRLIDVRSKQHIARIDRDVASTALAFEPMMIKDCDAVVISDYDKGSISYALIETVRREFLGPIFVDTKKNDLARLAGCVVKINALEHSRLVTLCDNLVVTQGPGGALYKDKTFKAPGIEVTDVCGAGDTFLAALVMGWLDTEDMAEAIEFAIRASAVTVQHLGAYAPTRAEIDQIVG